MFQHLVVLIAIVAKLSLCLPNSILELSETSIATSTNETLDATSLGPSNEAVTCYPVKMLPSDFHCHDALGKVYGSIIGDDSTVYTLTRLPTLSPTSTKVRVPRFWRSGSCEIVLNTKNRVPDIRVYASDLRSWAGQLINTCVKDETRTGGGILNVDFEPRMVWKSNGLFFEAKLKPYSSIENGTESDGEDGNGSDSGTAVGDDTTQEEGYPSHGLPSGQAVSGTVQTS